jgi:hypothetical protein
VFGAALALYLHADYSVPAFVLLFLVPDLTFAAYLVSPAFGALAYNTMHTEVSPIALGAIGVLVDSQVLVQIALIWLGHIGVDRMLGYGLKYPTGFKDTHLHRV